MRQSDSPPPRQVSRRSAAAQPERVQRESYPLRCARPRLPVTPPRGESSSRSRGRPAVHSAEEGSANHPEPRHAAGHRFEENPLHSTPPGWMFPQIDETFEFIRFHHQPDRAYHRNRDVELVMVPDHRNHPFPPVLRVPPIAPGVRFVGQAGFLAEGYPACFVVFVADVPGSADAGAGVGAGALGFLARVLWEPPRRGKTVPGGTAATKGPRRDRPAATVTFPRSGPRVGSGPVDRGHHTLGPAIAHVISSTLRS